MVPNCLLTCGTTEECDEAGPPKGQKLCMAMTVRTCLVWTLEVLILLMFCLGVAVLVEFVVVHPQPPKCDISSLTLSNFSTSSMNANASAAHDGRGSFTPVQMLTAVIAVTVKAHNQITHIGTFYDHVHVMVSYHRDLIGEDWVEPFYQGRSNTDLLQTQVEVHNLQVSPDTGTQLLADIKDQSVEFGVALHVLTRVRILNIITHHFRVHVRCDITVTPLTETNRQSTLLSKSCREKTHWLSNH